MSFKLILQEILLILVASIGNIGFGQSQSVNYESLDPNVDFSKYVIEQFVADEQRGNFIWVREGNLNTTISSVIGRLGIDNENLFQLNFYRGTLHSNNNGRTLTTVSDSFMVVHYNWADFTPNFTPRFRSFVGLLNYHSGEIWLKDIKRFQENGQESGIEAYELSTATFHDDILTVYAPASRFNGVDQIEISGNEILLETKYSLLGDIVEQRSFKLDSLFGFHSYNRWHNSKRINTGNILIGEIGKESEIAILQDTVVFVRVPHDNGQTPVAVKLALEHQHGSSKVAEGESNELFWMGKFGFRQNEYPFDRDQFVILKLDQNLQPVWARIYQAQKFRPYEHSLVYDFDSDKLIAGFATVGSYPAILATIDPLTGSVIESKGYPVHSPHLSKPDNGPLVIASESYFNEDGVLVPGIQVITTSLDGILIDCSTESACIESIPFEVPWAPLGVESYPNFAPVEYDDYEVTITPFEPEISYGCHTPAFPEPTFQIPQTLCIQDTLKITNLKNQLANGYEWQLTGPNDFEQHFDNENPENLTLSQPGTYYLRQTIYVLGCAYEYEQPFEVIDEASVASETITVCEFPAEVTLQSNCDSIDITWDDGSIGSRTVTAPGEYAVTVCSGLCANEFLISVRPASELLPDPLFLLPTDSAICPRDFPLQIDAPPDLVTTLNGEPAPLRLDAPGAYRLGYLIDDCLYEQTLNLTAADCTPRLFVPNAFSPNNDGVNDYLELSGNENIELRTLEVYDRWGARVYRQLGGRLRWDGRVEGNPAGAGTYVVRVVYVEVHTGEEVEVAQDVALLR